MLVKLNYCSDYFIQNKSKVKNNSHSLFLQESPAKDDLLLFTYPKLTCSDTEPNSWLATYLFSSAPVSQQARFVVSV